MEEFWKYVAEYIERVEFSEVNEKMYGMLFSNESTVIMGKIKEMCGRLAPTVSLIFRPDIFIYPVPAEAKHLVPATTEKVAMVRNMLILSTSGNEFINPEVEKLYAAHLTVDMPNTWLVVKYVPAKFIVEGAYEYDGTTLSTNSRMNIIDAIGEYNFSKLRIPIAYCSVPTKPLSGLYAELGLNEKRCEICKLAEIHTILVENKCRFCARLKLPI